MIEGIDVSGWQPKIDWSQVADNFQFAYIKASEGTTVKNKLLDSQSTGASNAGLPFGVYHFARPATDPVANAQLAKSLARGQLPLALDIEEAGGKDRAHVVAWCHAFLEELGSPAIIYTGPSFADQFLDSSLGSYKLWLAHYTAAPKPMQPKAWHASPLIWQYSGNGKAAGVAGTCDLNHWLGTDAMFEAFVAGEM